MIKENVKDEFETLCTTDRRSVLLDYIFQNKDEYIQPKNFRKHYGISSRFSKTISRYFLWFETKWVLLSKLNEDGLKEKDLSRVYNTDYKMTEDRVHYNIPSIPLERYNYANMITSLLSAYDERSIEEISAIRIINGRMFSSQKLVMKGLVRDTLLSVEINDYFDYSKGSIFSVLVDLTNYKQSIDLEIESDVTSSNFKNIEIDKIVVNEDTTIELYFNDMSVKLKSINEIKNIVVLTNYKPKSKTHFRITKKEFLDEFKKNDNYSKLKEIYLYEMEELQSEIDDTIEIDFDKYIENSLRDKQFPKIDRDNMSEIEIGKIKGKDFIDRCNKHMRVK